MPMRAAHPRSRGENVAQSIWVMSPRGSSPLTRGKHLASDPRDHSRGLIPAHAGKTNAGAAFCRSVRAHPRSRGENRAPGLATTAHDGSSPLTRGKPAMCVAGHAITRLIPAHAGKTFPIRAVLTNNWAHPRSRGENQISAHLQRAYNGSSPLTRGKREHGADAPRRERLIPAHAGKTGNRSKA